MSCAWCGQPLAAPAELEAGTLLGGDRYQVLRVLGRGGFGITYDVGDRRLQRRVAMKELFPESAVRHGSVVLAPPQARDAFRTAKERFLREARVLARFTHPGIVRVYEVFEAHGTAYLVMELLDGRTLTDLLMEHGRPFGEPELLDIGGRVAAALRPVHAAGVLHRDVNPSNIMLTRHGRVVVIDFGLARSYHDAHTAGVTRLVTPGYAPVEQYRGEGRFGPWTDVYGLAATLYRLGTGRIPVAAVNRDAGVALPSPCEVNPSLSRTISDAILDGLELEPQHRPQDLDAFLARLKIRRLPEGPRAALLDVVEFPATGPATRPDPSRSEPLRPEPSRPESSPPAAALPPGGEASPEPVPVGDRPSPVPGGDATRIVDPDSLYGESAGTTMVGGAGVSAADRTMAGPPPQDRTVAAPTSTRGEVEPGRDSSDRAVVTRAGSAPIAIGPHRPGRRKITVPALFVGMAFGAALPLVATAVVAGVVVPLLATVGDSVAHRLRRAHGVAQGWAERRMSPAALAPTRYLRNLVMCVVRSSPLIGLGAALLAAWYALDGLNLAAPAMAWMLRGIGAFTVGGILATSRVGSARFRTGLGIDDLVARWIPDGRTNERVMIGWLVAAALVAGLLWLDPDTFPLP